MYVFWPIDNLRIWMCKDCSVPTREIDYLPLYFTFSELCFVLGVFFCLFLFCLKDGQICIWHEKSLPCMLTFCLWVYISLAFVFMVCESPLSLFLFLTCDMHVNITGLCCFVFLEVVHTSFVFTFIHLNTIWSKENTFENFETKNSVTKSSHLLAKITVKAGYFVGLFLWLFRKHDHDKISHLLQQ